MILINSSSLNNEQEDWILFPRIRNSSYQASREFHLYLSLQEESQLVCKKNIAYVNMTAVSNMRIDFFFAFRFYLLSRCSNISIETHNSKLSLFVFHFNYLISKKALL